MINNEKLKGFDIFSDVTPEFADKIQWNYNRYSSHFALKVCLFM